MVCETCHDMNTIWQGSPWQQMYLPVLIAWSTSATVVATTSLAQNHVPWVCRMRHNALDNLWKWKVSERRACPYRRQEVPLSRKGCDVAGKGVPLLSLLDTARMVRCRHAILNVTACVSSYQCQIMLVAELQSSAALLPLLSPCEHSILIS